MADGTRLNPGVDGDMAATDEINDGGVANAQKVQRIKAGWGADNSYKDPTYTSPLPVGVIPDTTGVSNAGTILTPKFAKIVATGSGDTLVILGVTSKKIRVQNYVFSCGVNVDIKFRSGTSPGTDLTGTMPCAQYGGVASSFAPLGHFETVEGEGLYINLSGATTVGGHLQYIEI